MSKRRRIDRPLTEREQALAAEAMGYAKNVVRSYCHRYGDVADWKGEAGLRITRHITTYDPAQSELRKWAIAHAHFACQDAMRFAVDWQLSRKGNRRLKMISYYNPMPNDHRPYIAVFAEQEHAAPPDIEPLLSRLDPRIQAILVGSFIQGQTMKALADAHGLSESRICQIRTEAILWIRQNHRREEVVT